MALYGGSNDLMRVCQGMKFLNGKMKIMIRFSIGTELGAICMFVALSLNNEIREYFQVLNQHSYGYWSVKIIF